jgi:hypothetical protein
VSIHPNIDAWLERANLTHGGEPNRTWVEENRRRSQRAIQLAREEMEAELQQIIREAMASRVSTTRPCRGGAPNAGTGCHLAASWGYPLTSFVVCPHPPVIWRWLDPIGATLTQLDRARAVCEGCPVRQECLDVALADDSLVGLWGGFTAKERAELRPARVA